MLSEWEDKIPKLGCLQVLADELAGVGPLLGIGFMDSDHFI